uniref:C2H2-type domain-containing protein n=1 Tax=viral metagenome TaxID=1070528 RepID=A0A6C0HWY2_9ZZZZ
MPLRQCRFCDYNTIEKYYYYSHLYMHISEDTIKLFTDEEIKLCNFYYNKRNQKQAKYRNNNKEKIAAKSKYYRQRMKLGKQENYILIEESDDDIIIEYND